MSNITNINDYRPHLYGPALCTGCKAQWVATAPIGTRQLDCPECGSCKGLFTQPCIPDEFWRCACGNDLYYITEDGCVCRECGSIAKDAFL